jgi:hypothetical protein
MADFGALALHFGLFLYAFTMDVAVALALALTLTGYDIKQNWRRILTCAVILGAAGVVYYHFPQPLRVVFYFVLHYMGISWFFRIGRSKIILVFFTFLILQFASQCIACPILYYGFRITLTEFMSSAFLRLMFPLSYNIPMAVLSYISYHRGWRLFINIRALKSPAKLLILPLIQFFLLMIIINELFFTLQSKPVTWASEVGVQSVLIVATLISICFIWRILRLAEREAATLAQELVTKDMLCQTAAIKDQRHDFNNHLQIIMGLVRDRQKQEVGRYLKTLKRERSIAR